MTQILNWSAAQVVNNSVNCYSSDFGLAYFNNTLFCAYQGPNFDGWVRLRTYANGNWSNDDWLIPDANNAYGLTASPALAVFENKLWIAHQGRSQSGWMWYSTSPDGQNWGTDNLAPNSLDAYGLSESPALCASTGWLWCVRQGRGQSRKAWFSHYEPGVGWSFDSPVEYQGNVYGLSGSPALASYQQTLFCVRRGASGGKLWWGVSDPAWSPDTCTNITSHSSPSLAVFKNNLFCSYIADSSNNIGIARFDGTNWVTDKWPNVQADGGSPSLCTIGNQLILVFQYQSGIGWAVTS